MFEDLDVFTSFMFVGVFTLLATDSSIPIDSHLQDQNGWLNDHWGSASENPSPAGRHRWDRTTDALISNPFYMMLLSIFCLPNVFYCCA